jgi:hypothetical protein
MTQPPADDLDTLARSLHAQISGFLLSLTEVARGDEPDFALAHLMLETSQLCLAGGRLAALADVRLDDAFEADPGDDADLDGVREGLRRLLGELDVYADVVDPVLPDRGTAVFRISDELASVAADLLHGLAHYSAGRVAEALWWWQYSYFSSWGPALTSALRAIQSLVAHTRLDSDPATTTTGTMT